VDRDTDGYVDFEKMFGVERCGHGHVVANYDSKKLQEGRKEAEDHDHP